MEGQRKISRVVVEVEVFHDLDDDDVVGYAELGVRRACDLVTDGRVRLL